MSAARTAAALQFGGLGLLFGVRSWQHRRRTGDTGFRGFDRSATGWARWSEPAFAAALVATTASPLLASARVLPVLGAANGPAAAVRVGAGAVLAVTGLALTWAAQTGMGSSWRVGVDQAERTALVTAGLFGRVRNPIFTGMVLAEAGLALLAPTRLSVAGVGLLVAACQVQVRRVEEPYLLAQHGEAYRRYAARTGRFVPGLGRRP